MAAAPSYGQGAPKEVFQRLQRLYARSDWGRVNLVTLSFEDTLPTPAMYEVSRAYVAEHDRSILLLIGTVLPNKAHLIFRAGSLVPGRYKRFEEALRDMKESSSANAVRALGRPGSLYTDRLFIKPIDSEQELMSIATKVLNASVTDRIVSNAMRYPHLLLPPVVG